MVPRSISPSVGLQVSTRTAWYHLQVAPPMTYRLTFPVIPPRRSRSPSPGTPAPRLRHLQLRRVVPHLQRDLHRAEPGAAYGINASTTQTNVECGFPRAPEARGLIGRQEVVLSCVNGHDRTGGFPGQFGHLATAVDNPSVQGSFQTPPVAPSLPLASLHLGYTPHTPRRPPQWRPGSWRRCSTPRRPASGEQRCIHPSRSSSVPVSRGSP